MKWLAYISALLLLFVASGCDRDEIPSLDEAYQIKQLNIDAPGEIRQFMMPGDSLWFVCGGDKSGQGFIYRSTNQGNTWERVLKTENLSVNAMFYSPDAGYWAGGDSISLWRSEDGINWTQNPEAPCYWSNCRNPYHAVHVWKQHLFFGVGGEYFQRGITSRSTTGNSYWVQLYWPNQFNDLLVASKGDGEHVYIAGYAMVLHSSDSAQNFSDMNMREKNYIAIRQNSKGIFMLSEDGSVFQLEQDAWEHVSASAGRFRDMDFNTREGLVAGDDGRVFRVNLLGREPRLYAFPDGKNLSAVKGINDDFLIGTRSGNLYYLQGNE